MQKAYSNFLLEKSYCIFVDILGFSQEVINHDKDETYQKHLNDLRNCIDMAMVKFDKTDSYSLKIFTDNIVIGVPFKKLTELSSWCDEDEVNDYAAGAAGDVLSKIYGDYFDNIIEPTVYYQLEMILGGFFVRGGWDYGMLYMDSKIVYGKSLIDAHLLEEEKALYPRIVLGEHLIKMIDRQIYNKEVLEPLPHNRKFEIYGNATIPYILQGEEGIYFINYLIAIIDIENKKFDSSKLKKHKEIIERKICKYRRKNKVLEKYSWSAFYHNRFCEIFIRNWLGEKEINDYLIEDIPIYKKEWKVDWILLDYVERKDIRKRILSKA